MVGGIFFSLFFSLLPIAIIAAVVGLIVLARRESVDDGEVEDAGIGTVWRLFIYGLSLVALAFVTSGIAMLVGGALDAAFGDTLIAERHSDLAVALSFTVVGAPAWLLLALAAQRSIAAHAVERRSHARRSYLSLARGIALSIIVINAVEVGRFVVGVNDFDGGAWGWLLAWAAVWLLHERLAVAEPAPTATTRLLDRLYGYFGTVLGFALLVTGAATMLQAPLEAAYDAAFRASFLGRPWSEDLRSALVVLAIGVAVWGWHWLRALARRDRLTTLWQTYIFLVGILSGVALVVVTAAVMLHAVLEWWIGEPLSSTAAEHFSLVPGAIAVLAASAGAWGYHRAALAEALAVTGAPAPPPGPERIYRYLVAAAGLFTASLGLVMLFAVAADALSGSAPELLRVGDWWRSRFVTSVTLLAVGLPLWARYWFVSQHITAAPGDERAAQSRRVFLFGVIGVAILAALIALTIVLYQLFQAVLDGALSRAVLHDARWGIGTALTAAASAGYYWLVMREDQADREGAAPSAAPTRRREVVLIAAAPFDALIGALEQVEGVRVRAWRRTDSAGGGAAPLSAEQLAAMREAVARADADRIAVIVGGAGFEVVPYTS